MDSFMRLSQEMKWFDDWRSTDAAGRRGPPIALLVMCALRVLGGTKFNDFESSHISQGTVRRFFHYFVKVGAEKMYPHLVRLPMTADEISRAMNYYSILGFDGAIGSVDGFAVELRTCPANLKNSNVGKEGFPTRGFQILVGFDTTIYHLSESFKGTANDQTKARNDPVFYNIVKGDTYSHVTWKRYDSEGNEHTMNGVWILCDNGYPLWPKLVPPYLYYNNEEKRRLFSEWLESARKDVERTIGILKQRFQILKNGIGFQKFVSVENVVRTCAALHNFIRNQRSRREEYVSIDRREELYDAIQRAEASRRSIHCANLEPDNPEHEAFRRMIVENFIYKLNVLNTVRWPRQQQVLLNAEESQEESEEERSNDENNHRN